MEETLGFEPRHDIAAATSGFQDRSLARLGLRFHMAESRGLEPLHVFTYLGLAIRCIANSANFPQQHIIYAANLLYIHLSHQQSL